MRRIEQAPQRFAAAARGQLSFGFPTRQIGHAMTVATMASVVFFACSLVAALAVEFVLTSFARSIGINRLVFVVAFALLAMLYALVVYQNAERKIRRLGESVSRGILVMLLAWASFSALIAWAWHNPGEFASCFGTTLLASGAIGGGPMLLDALGAGTLTGVLVLRRPPPRIG